MQTLLEGLSVTAVGMLVVFVGLVILIGCVKLITLAGKDHKGKEKPAPKSETRVNTPAPAPVAAPAVQAGIPADVVAAITAAIAAVWEGERGFTVKHIKRVQNAPAWSRAGREEQTYSRL